MSAQQILELIEKRIQQRELEAVVCWNNGFEIAGNLADDERATLVSLVAEIRAALANCTQEQPK